MDCSLSYADILQKTLQEVRQAQPRLQAIKLYPVCDNDSGHFLILATSWNKQRWLDTKYLVKINYPFSNPKRFI